jgi:hypothetical protein
MLLKITWNYCVVFDERFDGFEILTKHNMYEQHMFPSLQIVCIGILI